MKIEFPKYDYPSLLFDFENLREIAFESYRELENHIGRQLQASNASEVRDGLSNVLYWGHNRAGYRDIRVEKFRKKVSDSQIANFSTLIKESELDALSIKGLEMPEFSGLAFVSKIMMFSNPRRYVTLDKKIMELSDSSNLDSPLTQINFSTKDTTIRITKNTATNYLKWCEICELIAGEFFNGLIAADVERGFFKLIEADKVDYGREIIRHIIERKLR